jgi:plasmid stability protein
MLSYMSTTLTVRIAPEERQALRRRAAQARLTVSELVREILRQALADRPVSARAGHLKGRLRMREPDAGSWRRQIRERNWRR